ncbi:MAG: hypothetical protein ABIX01_17125 [Chitinophagaceae bacterium]
MKKLISAALLLSAVICYAQKPNITWSKEFKMKNGSNGPKVVLLDQSGIYLEGQFSFEQGTLTRLDKDFKLLYSNDYGKELKGKDFERFFVLKDKIFLLATDYLKREKKLTLFGLEIDKNTGEQSGDWQEIVSLKSERDRYVNYHIGYTADSNNMVIVSFLPSGQKTNFEIQKYNTNLKPVSNPISITNEFEAKAFFLNDVLYTSGGNVAVTVRIPENEEGKPKTLCCGNYNFRIYDGQGKKLKEIDTEVSGKWVVASHWLQTLNKEIMLVCFLSDEKGGKEITGMLVQRIDPQTGNVISKNQKDFDTPVTMLNTPDDAPIGEVTKSVIQEREWLRGVERKGEGFPKHVQVTNISFTADSGVVIIAEKCNSYILPVSGVQSSANVYQEVYHWGDLLMCRIDAPGTINWVHVVPRKQWELFTMTNNVMSIGKSYFSRSNNRPFYSGAGVFPSAGKITIVFNDHKRNTNVVGLGQRVEPIGYLTHADCFALTLDAATGKYTRTVLFINDDAHYIMPRHGNMLGREVYLTAESSNKNSILRFDLSN